MSSLKTLRLNSFPLVAVASMAMALGACDKGGKSKNPDDAAAQGNGPAVGQPGAPTVKAKEDFMKAVEVDKKANADGNLTTEECNKVAGEWNRVYKAHGAQMMIAGFNAAATYDACGNAEQAKAGYEALAKQNFHLALNNLGVMEWKAGNHEKALDYFQKSIDADKKQAFAARNNVAAAKRDAYAEGTKAEDFELAQRMIQNVLAVDSSNKAAYENLARLYYDRGRLKDKSYLLLANLVVTQAVRVLEKEGEKSADILNLRGLLFMQENNQVDALKAFKAAVEVDPNHKDANLNIAFISIRFRDYASAEKSLEISLKYADVASNIEAVIAMGVSKRGMKKFKEAVDYYEKAAKLDPKDPRPIYNLGILNHEHLTGQDDVDAAKIEELYNVAKKHFSKTKELSGSNKTYAAISQDSADRIIIIDDAIAMFRKAEELQKRADELAELEKKQAEEERQRLLELEKQAQAAADSGGDSGDGGGE